MTEFTLGFPKMRHRQVAGHEDPVQAFGRVWRRDRPFDALENRDFHAVQVEAIRRLATKPVGIPAFVGKEVDYMTSHRMMGYVEAPVANTHPIHQPPYRQRTLDQFPEEFFLLRTNGGHGGVEMDRLVETARASGAYYVSPLMFERAGFRTTLYWVRRVGAQKP